jgi:hypothetical protein
MKRTIGSLVLLAGFVPGLGTSALACDTSSCALVTRGLLGVLPPGEFRIDTAFRRTYQTDPRAGSEEADEVVRPKVDLERDLLRPAVHREEGGRESFLQIDMAYGLAPRVSVVASLPLLIHRSYSVSHFGFGDQYQTSGIGDVLLGGRFAVGPKGLIGGFSFQVPTGPYRIGGDYDGSILDPTLQPGTGSFSAVVSLQYIRRAAGFDWSGAASYQFNTPNDEQYRFGNGAIAALTASRSLPRGLGASLQVKYVRQGHSEFRAWGLPLGASALVYQSWDVPSTGNTYVYLTPGLTASIPGGITAYGFFQLVPYRYVNETQLATRAAFLVGFSKTFERKRPIQPTEPLP